MPFTATFIVLSALGIANAAYLAFKHREGKPLVCPLDHDCNAVVESRWNKILGIRNEYLGVLFYAGLFIAALVTIFVPETSSTINRSFIYATGTGALYSAFLTLIQMIAIKDYCFYCLLSALTALLLFINSFFLL
ncbi:MAG: vitamin K epoxide reductase family protein [Patescibacteria group bacterium]